jgi:preprotein translocase subunit SecF
MLKFHILKRKSIWFSFSGILFVASLFLLFFPGFGLRPSIEFTGGSELQIKIGGDNTPTIDEFKGAFREALGEEKGERIVQEEGKNTFYIRSQTLTPEEEQAFLNKLKEKNFEADLEQSSTIGSSMGEYFQRQAFLTILTAIIAIVLFIAWAFRKIPHGISSWKFGAAAILALIHDVTIIAGFFALLGRFMTIEVDTLFVTALLTVMGFSVHDTIVVFDRLRENLKGEKGKNIENIAEISVWQTMGRSINTSLSTLLILVAVLIFGPSTIFPFILALVFGMMIGTYSSIFIAVPMLVTWLQPKHHKES